MNPPNPPPQGQMYLFDSITPPLQDGSYRMTVGATVTYSGGPPAYSQPYYFDIVGPRFSLPPGMVAGCFPPADGHGEFNNYLPQIVISRRTLPWERSIAPTAQMPASHPPSGPPPLAGPVPWVALLLFAEGEYTLNHNVPLDQALPPAVFQALGSPAGITCDVVTASKDLVEAILPSVDELQLLAHVRWVNVQDRELNTAGGDGFYSVVVANRLPQSGGQYRAFLVSLEGRTDLVQGDPPPSAAPPPGRGVVERSRAQTTSGGAAASAGPARTGAISTNFSLSQTPVHNFTPLSPSIPVRVNLQTASLVVLSSWKFTCEGPGPFRNLMQNLDVAMFGTAQNTGHPPVTDTGHLPVTLNDRLGATEQAWYRGPLVPWQLTRDTLGPYHCADQCRRATPETGAEDLSYAAAFEVGRLLAAADPRLAQALMRWRRESYQQSARASTIADVRSRISTDIPSSAAAELHAPIAPFVAVAATESVLASKPAVGDAYGWARASQVPGVQAAAVQQAWQLGSPAEASALLGDATSALAAPIAAPPRTDRVNTTLAVVAADTAGLARLGGARTLALQDVTLEES